MTKIGDLLDYNYDTEENINLVLSAILMSEIPNLVLFGGLIRDLLANKTSNDSDFYVISDEPNFKLINGKFEDLFIKKIQQAIESYDIKLTNLTRKIDILNKYPMKEDTEELIQVIDDSQLLDIIENPSCIVEHIKYTGEANNYYFELDFSFVRNFDDIICVPTVKQDSLYINENFKNVFNKEIVLTEKAEDILNNINEHIKENIDSLLNENIYELINSLKDGILEVYNIDKLKRLKKLSKYIKSGYKLKKTNKGRIKCDIHNNISKIISSHYYKSSYEDKKEINNLLALR